MFNHCVPRELVHFKVLCYSFLLLWLQEKNMNTDKETNEKLVQKATEFTKELLLLAEKYNIEGMYACGCCDGLTIDFKDLGWTSMLRVETEGGKIQGEFETRIYGELKPEKTVVKIR